jgi:hypothetical protein
MAMSYLDIKNLYRFPDILQFKEVYALEKIHGTSSHIRWDGNVVYFFSGGEKYDNFCALFDKDKLQNKFIEIVGNKKTLVCGEAYGGKQQKMSETYGKQLRFIVFDVKIDDTWLNVINANNFANNLGLEFVHYQKIAADITEIDAQRDADSVQAIRNGVGTGKMREGIVLRPPFECVQSNGERLIAKHKREEFAERKHTPKVVDVQRLEVLQKAEEIAEEWVVPMRLEHVLQEHLEIVDMSHTSQLIRAMIVDIYKEASGEIVENKDVETAIGRKTAKLWKERIKNNFRSDNS